MPFRKITDRAEALNHTIIIRLSEKLFQQLEYIRSLNPESSIAQICREMLSEHEKIQAIDHVHLKLNTNPAARYANRKAKRNKCAPGINSSNFKGAKQRIKKAIDYLLSSYSVLTPVGFKTGLSQHSIQVTLRFDKRDKLAGVSFTDLLSGFKIVGSDLGEGYGASSLIRKFGRQARKEMPLRSVRKRPAKRNKK